MNFVYDLSGNWAFRLDNEKKGIEAHYERSAFDNVIRLPGTTSEQKKGAPNPARETGSLTVRYLTEGYAWYQRTLSVDERVVGQHAILRLERTRISHVWVDGVYAGSRDSLCTAHVYDLTALITNAHPVLTLMTSNTDYPVRGGHMTSPDTQTNWNGILGSMTLRFCEAVDIRRLRLDVSFRKRILSGTIDLENYPGDRGARLAVCVLPVTLESLTLPIGHASDSSALQAEHASDSSALQVEHVSGSSALQVEHASGSSALQVEHTSGLHTRLAETPASSDDALLTPEQVFAHPDARRIADIPVHLVQGENRLHFEAALPEELPVWDEYDPAVLRIAVKVTDGTGRGGCSASWCGIREFEARGMHFFINGRKTFLRGKHEGMVFPLTGYAPMNVSGWLRVMQKARQYGINHYRFHTCCPPEAAFLAADLLGICLEPELPFWGTFAAEGEEGFDEAAQTYLAREGFRILDAFGNHPSFCMMSMGNELWGSPQAVSALVSRYKEYDNRHLYTQGSNNFQWTPNIQNSDDFFCGVRFASDRLLRGSYAMCDSPLGHVQTDRPCTDFSYEAAIFPHVADTACGQAARPCSEAAPCGEDTTEIQYGTGVKRVKLSESDAALIPAVPVISHEIGQYETYPDFDEIAKYTGVLEARNFEIFRERLAEKGLLPMAKDYFRCSGALAAACYKDELETALRTGSLAGFQILDLQDFPGQGTALVGMLDAFMDSKGILSAEEYRSFCSDAVLQAQFSSYIAGNGTEFSGTLSLSWYRRYLPDHIRVVLSLTDLADCMPDSHRTDLTDCMPDSRRIDLTDCMPDSHRTDLTDCMPDSRQTDPADRAPVFRQVLSYAAPLEENGCTVLGPFSFPLPPSEQPEHYELSVRCEEEGISNRYELWTYPSIDETRLHSLDGCWTASPAQAVTQAEQGVCTVLCLAPEQNPHSVPGTYCTDFWCYPMFRSISESMKKEVPIGTMGLLIRTEHPALSGFPSNRYTTPQWWDIVTSSASTILDDTSIIPVVQTIDNFERNHRLGLIYEVRIAGTHAPILVCTSPLPQLAEAGRTEAFWLLNSLCQYAATWKEDAAHPVCTMEKEAFLKLFQLS